MDNKKKQPEKPMDTEKKVVEKDSLEKKEDEGTKKEAESTPPTTPSSSPVLWILVVILFVVLLAGAVYLGLSAERAVGGKILNALPKALTKTWGKTIIAPTPTETPVVAGTVTPTIANMHTLAPTEEPTPPSDADVTDESFILSFSNMQKLVREDLVDLSPWELKVARNEIYARHGRPFVSKDLSCYFAKQTWYTIDPAYKDSSLSSLETANAVFILSYENEIQSPLVNKDSGCQ